MSPVALAKPRFTVNEYPQLCSFLSFVIEATGKPSGTISSTGSLDPSSTNMSWAWRGAASARECKKWGKYRRPLNTGTMIDIDTMIILCYPNQIEDKDRRGR